MAGNLNMKSRSIINVKQVGGHAADFKFVGTTIGNNINTLITTDYQKYVNNRLNLSVGGAHL